MCILKKKKGKVIIFISNCAIGSLRFRTGSHRLLIRTLKYFVPSIEASVLSDCTSFPQITQSILSDCNWFLRIGIVIRSIDFNFQQFKLSKPREWLTTQKNGLSNSREQIAIPENGLSYSRERIINSRERITNP